MNIYQADIEDSEHRKHIKVLFEEYLYWANDQLKENFNISFDIPEIIEGDMQTLAKFAPPAGRLLLAEIGDDIAGLACMRKIRDNIAEIKRMYVRPAFRRMGVGRALVEMAVEEARIEGYEAVYLDSARYMIAAHALYRGMGFQEFEEYPESEIPSEFRQNWIFMHLPIR